ncbi:putative inorganic phosphate cotransporter [Drosophila tropicalis]|uniref:putative inorganic phosphate cotransporter n=1 Tax=Drosophila tropicalis TaxID=46794 RepID=UPI0035AB91E0
MTTTLNMVKTGKYANERFIGVRHVQCLLCFFCLSLAYAWRVNLSMALVAMTGSDAPSSNATAGNNETNSNASLEDMFFFTETQKSYMLSSFFWGYIVTQVPGGYVAQRYGAKMLLLSGLLACAMLTLLSPMAVQYGGWQALCIVRFVQGLTQGAVHPATHSLLSKWAPAHERGTLATICYSGSQFGSIAMLALSGVIADSALGWPGIFYLGGAAGFVWMILWYAFASSTPEENRLISAGELKYIKESRTQGTIQSAETLAPTPWAQIFTSKPFLSLTVVHCTHMWGFWTLLTQIPSYLKYIYGQEIKTNALLSSLPYVVMMVMSFFFVWLSKVLANQKSLSLSFNRKFFNSIGHWIPMCSLIALGYLPRENFYTAVTLLTLTVGISAATYLGFQVNHIDLSPNYAGTLMGITNGAANVMSALAPLAVGWIVTDPENVNDWRMVFFLAAFFYFIGNLLFVIFGRTNIQKWDSPNSPVLDVEAAVPLKSKN